MKQRRTKRKKISTRHKDRLPSGYFLFLLRTLYAVICPGESQDWLDRTDRTYTSFFIKGAGRTFSCYTEQQGVIRPHALIIRRARFADAFCPVIHNDCVLVINHGIPLLASVSGTGSGQGMRSRKSGLIINYHGLPDNEIMPCLPVGRARVEIFTNTGTGVLIPTVIRRHPTAHKTGCR
jgi:hypothetical protein